MIKPSVLCPVDFSEASRGALRYAAALAEHFAAELLVITVNDPLLAEAAAMDTSAARVRQDTLGELTRFTAESIDRPLKGATLAFEVMTGKPAQEILRVVGERRPGVLVISSHGLTGFRKMFFGSTTERVLRETQVPVLIVPGSDRGPRRIEDIAPMVRRILLPVEFNGAAEAQLPVAAGLAAALGASVVLLNVVEPVRAVLPAGERHLPSIERERRARAEGALDALKARLPAGVKSEAIIAYGEPSEEIAKVAGDRNAGLIIMGLYASPLMGPRIGSVTYRVLSSAHRLLLALPPA